MSNMSWLFVLALVLGCSGAALAQEAAGAGTGSAPGGEGQSFGNLPLTGYAYNDGSR